MLNISFCHSCLLLLLLFPLSYAFPPELILFSGADQTGDGIILRSKQNNLIARSSDFMPQIRSYCYRGHWAFYGEKDFSEIVEEDYSESLKCVNMDTRTFLAESARFLGPGNTDTISLTFYESGNFMNKEFIVNDKPVILPFLPGSFVSNSGHSHPANWSFFEENDYAAKSICYTQMESHEQVRNLKKLFVKGIKTVSKGCNLATQLKGYYTAAQLESL